jgi:hypothetical protein
MQGSEPGLRYGTAFCRHRKSGLPSTPPNHKSDSGSLQSWNRPPPQLPATGLDERRLLSLHAKRLQVIATNFAGVLPWRGNRLREENGRVCSRAGSVRANKLVRFPGFGSKGSAGDDGFKRNHGKVRIKPRQYGCGRHRHDTQAPSGGHSIIRHPLSSRHTAAGFAPPAAADGCRGETK